MSRLLTPNKNVMLGVITVKKLELGCYCVTAALLSVAKDSLFGSNITQPWNHQVAGRLLQQAVQCTARSVLNQNLQSSSTWHDKCHANQPGDGT